MPRRKKNGQSPARVPGGPSEGGSLGHSAGYRLPQGYDGAMASNFPSSDSLSGSAKEKIAKTMQEMFSHLDPEVIYIVLSECDFKGENAMDSLLELSVAAEVAVPIPPPPSGFERTAAALLSPRHFSEPRPDPDSSKPSQPPSSPPSTILLTEELDLLVDQELETLTAQQDVKKVQHSTQYLSAGASLSSLPPPPFPLQALPELLQSGQELRSRGPSAEQACPLGDLGEQTSGTSSPLNQLSSWDSETADRQQSVVDFTHLLTETPADKPNRPLDLAALGRPSAFQVYKKQDPPHSLSERAGVMPTDGIVGGARSKVNMLNREPLGCMTSPWNLEAPVFSPHIHANQGPTFITPVVQTPSKWPSQSRHASPWLSHAPVGQAPLKPSATNSKSWALPAAPQLPAQYSRLRLEGKVLVLLRGAPGSGKSKLARALLEHNPGGVILSTDDYFSRHGKYQFDPTVLGEAHEWNHKRAKEAFERGTNPIIIDNTNMQGWEMKPYVAQALKHGYKVLFREPDTWWKNKPRELERRTTHNVSVETIRRMLNGYERFVTVQSIMGSHMPEWKQGLLLENSSSQLVSETPCPDLVGQPGLTERCKKSRSQLFSSLPDVSSVGRSSEVGKLEDGDHTSTESLNFQPTSRPMEDPEASDGDNDMDLGELDSDLKAQLQLRRSPDQGIPDCIVESVMNEDHRGDEIPVAFSESIGQRVRRERSNRSSGLDKIEPADLVKDANQSESEAKEKEKVKEEEAEGVEVVRDDEEKGMPKILDFLGDWPSEGSLEQRQVRRRERNKERNGKEDEGVAKDGNGNKVKVQPGPGLTEFQKVLDLIQTGVGAIQTGSSCSSSLSLSSDEELLKEEEADGRFEESCGSKSNSEEREQNMNRVNDSRGELPDCVLGWKAADSGRVRKSRIDNWEELKIEIEASIATGGNDQVSEIGREKPNCTYPHSAITADSLLISETAETNICHDGVGSRSIEGEVGTEPGDTEDGRETRTEADGSYVSEVCRSPMCEGSVDAEGSAFSGGSQERKQRQGRRSGKQCKLALTFTQNCPGSSLNTPESPSTAAQNVDSSQNSINTDVKPSFNPNCNTSLDLKPNFDLLTESQSEAYLQPPSPPSSLVDTGCFTQTEPQDFALLWRLSRQDSPDATAVTTCSNSSNFAVLYGDSSRFVPELSSVVSAAVAVHPSGHKEVPYQVVHEKGTQVEEKELEATQDRLESLCILSRHFKLVRFDILEDLYDKCHQDLEWTTNLLLDSGESFFKDEDDEEERKVEEEDGAEGEDNQKTSSLCGALGEVAETRLCPNVLGECPSEDLPKGRSAWFEEGTQRSTSGTVSESNKSSSNTDLLSFEGIATPLRNKSPSDATSHSEKPPQTELSLPKATKERDNTEQKVISEPDLEGGACGGSLDDGVIIAESRTETEVESPSMDEVHWLLQADLEEIDRENKQSKEERTERRHVEERRSRHLDIQSVELKLPTELALQLTELFGPVGVDPGTCSTDDFEVQMDLNLAKLLHQKWKETIQERQRQANLSFHLLQENSYMSLVSQPEARGQMPFMDHWNVSHPHVSLRDIIKEEQALQKNMEKTRQSRADLDRRNGATLLKENQLYSLFPTIDRHFLQDIFRDHNYSLTQTELFLHSLLDEEPVKTVVAPEAPRSDHHRAASREREKRQKPPESIIPNYQDVEDPQYDDFRAEASLQKRRQLESFAMAAEAYKQGRKEVASFYAQQGHMHGQRMREANHRAAVQIFERVNSSLLPKNILDLHGLHVDEALEHLAQVLEDKTTDCEQGLCRPQLSVITGRGNHSQGGVARIRPAVIDYLTNKHYRFTEPKPGLVLVSLK
ncbi:NEDD4-binding protein 2 isoform X2 [Xiphias gladius]|uniref:NEDD4-binding protein 2 isoform X2 n=1 Tax=Xiphias gladius TaxID=8245 RepID=UPI001A98D858|nr:NEDD4-binding protein 2 isoform X2 [Xiphias gladius]